MKTKEQKERSTHSKNKGPCGSRQFIDEIKPCTIASCGYCDDMSVETTQPEPSGQSRVTLWPATIRTVHGVLQNYQLIISELPRAYVSKRSGRRRCEDFPAIDIRHPRYRELIDEPGSQISWRWYRNGQSYCEIDIAFRGDHAVLTDVMDRAQPQTLSIQLLRTPCHYGGSRSWFECPGCGQRCAKLYFSDGSFRCRTCLGLAYRSQLQASAERPRLIAQRIRRGLGGSSDLSLPFPAKPLKMNWRTYDRIREKGERYEARAFARLSDWFEGRRRR